MAKLEEKQRRKRELAANERAQQEKKKKRDGREAMSRSLTQGGAVLDGSNAPYRRDVVVGEGSEGLLAENASASVLGMVDVSAARPRPTLKRYSGNVSAAAPSSSAYVSAPPAFPAPAGAAAGAPAAAVPQR